MGQKNIFFAHSGGVTAVVNTIAASVINTAKTYKEINKVLVGKNGILGALREELIDVYKESEENINDLYHTPASAFGSCRYKLGSNDEEKFTRIIEVFKAHNINYFLYNGGNDSQDTTNKIWQMSQTLGYDLKCIGIPKTVDNDLAITDNCPGFGSVAKYIAVSIKEASLDVASMSSTSTKVFILEVMGRHAGWITAAAGLASDTTAEGPHILLFPEVPFEKEKFIQKVNECVARHGHCVIVASEGLCDKDGNFLAASNSTDSFGHQQLGGVAPWLAGITSAELKFKTHWAVADYLQRSARHLCSETDVKQAEALGKAAVDAVIAGKSGLMVTVQRDSNSPYKWSTGTANLHDVANFEKKLPVEFMSEDKMHITEAARTYLTPLIQGESYPPYNASGLPQYAKLKNILVPKQLPLTMVE
ncbi:MAG: 6-phosphofructokinase [Legionellales bacterium]|jgi:ATP-dependent phosphofructokinase / diphosphate-dependent phosphofructokinase|nr:6-phosphofructokinase [Legionellales bacterium]